MDDVGDWFKALIAGLYSTAGGTDSASLLGPEVELCRRMPRPEEALIGWYADIGSFDKAGATLSLWLDHY